MGLSIHYEGRIKAVSLIDELSNEVQDICLTMNWNSTIIDIPEAGIKGIVFAPPESELVCFTFQQNGRLISPLTFLGGAFVITEELVNELNYFCHTKTQYAGPDAHIAIIELMRYITGKYFSQFKMCDEGSYWENKDRQYLVEKFEFLDYAIDVVTSTLSEFKKLPGETPESVAERIEKILRQRFKGDQ